MAKFRPALTTQSAVHRAVGILGIERCAELIDKQPSTIYAYGDLDKERHISLEDALLLDMECLAVAGEAPFFGVMKAEIDKHKRETQGIDFTSALLEVHMDVGQLSAQVVECRAAASPGGAFFTLEEKTAINKTGLEILTDVHRLLDAVNGNEAKAAIKEAA